MKKEFIEIGNKIILIDGYNVGPMTEEMEVLASDSEYKPLIEWAPAIIDRILGDVLTDTFIANTFQTLECVGIFVSRLISRLSKYLHRIYNN